jgi:hypothetical protein
MPTFSSPSQIDLGKTKVNESDEEYAFLEYLKDLVDNKALKKKPLKN